MILTCDCVKQIGIEGIYLKRISVDSQHSCDCEHENDHDDDSNPPADDEEDGGGEVSDNGYDDESRNILLV